MCQALVSQNGASWCGGGGVVIPAQLWTDGRPSGILFVTANTAVVPLTDRPPTLTWQTLLLALLSTLTHVDNVIIHVKSSGY